ncbi:MAG: NfeD family protein [Brevinematia bacterium]
MRKIFLIFFLILLLTSFLFSSEKKVLILTIKEAITPVTEKYISRGLRVLKEEGFDSLLIILDTPGGLLDSTRSIVQQLLLSEKDTIVFVWPSGARAASAGVFITLAAKYAVMSPGCNIGAAHPVTIQGEDKGQNTKTLLKKMENDAVAFVESISKMRKRNSEWAIKSVRKSLSISSEEAERLKVIDFIATSVDEALIEIYGRDTKFIKKELKKNWAEKLLSILANPNISYILLILGFYGILYEIIHPGTIFSGVFGAICLILGLYSMQSLPVNFAGVLLIFLAFILFVLEFFIASYGLLSIGGIISLLLGSAMLFDTTFSFFKLSPFTIGFVIVFTTGLLIFIFFVLRGSLKKKVVSGSEGMIGLSGVAISDFSTGQGFVKVHGEIWRAISTDDIKDGDEVIVTGINGLSLNIKRK